MALPVQIFPRRLAFLPLKLHLLAFDPIEFRDRKDADGVEFHPLRGGDAHTASRRIYAEVDVLDVLEHNVHRNPTQIELRCHQYSRCALTTKKMRSTSATFCKISYRAALMVCSRGETPLQPSGRTSRTAVSIFSASASS